jgi:SSS family solute:Na+ symporter
MTEDTKLFLARSVTAILGVVCMGGAIYFVISGGEFIVTLLNLWLGTLSSAILIPLYGSLLWRRATALGALCSSVGGFLGYFTTLMLTEYGGVQVPGHPIFYGFGISLAAMVVISLVTKPVSDPEVNRIFFGDAEEPNQVTSP